jgi:RNA polymerase sigma-70 factor (ECF subfamily)
MNSTSEVADLYVALRDELCQFLRSRFGEGPPDPEDIVQAAFAKYAALEDTSNISNPRAFLYTASRNLTIDELRRNDRYRSYANEALIDAESENMDQISPERVLLANEQYSIVHETIAALPKAQREALTLHRLHEIPMEAISRKMGVSKTTVHRLIADAILTLHRAVKAKKLQTSEMDNQIQEKVSL